ncbi:peptide chain release factor N(5)-glutamine methyltransferase [uncultured Thiocystis sp.]|jgi:release factor glutamine methyltransferase|uniref:peptide chain release factor N(5)-glutamine methyltransferase n=1 Tax=uncultured Thiocystis sp. TaxID=1202134 RepID=UPI0025FBD49F|nr:peptide chain release factor N(5)-glutamine methyltransferase [uncultured Thiocystis sp.]
MNRIAETLREAAAALSALPDSSPRLEAELLLTQVSGWSRSHLLAWPERALDPATAADFHALLARRLNGEPIAYLRGQQSFWTLELKVSPATLIPRPETERLVETALERLVPTAPLRIADLGTGSGAIAAALASERPDWRLIATDRSAPALLIARDNFRALGLGGIDTVQADWLSAFATSSLDAILGNPPYIPDADPHLVRGDLRFEPPSALGSGRDGLDAIRAIVADTRRCLRPNGLLAVEHGFDQAREVQRLFRAAGLDRIETRQDLAGLDRVTLGYRPSETEGDFLKTIYPTGR